MAVSARTATERISSCRRPSRSGYKQNFVQCAKCGAPFGVTDYFNVGQLLKNQEKKIVALEAAVGALERAIGRPPARTDSPTGSCRLCLAAAKRERVAESWPRRSRAART